MSTESGYPPPSNPNAYDWDERTERFYTGESLPAQADPVEPAGPNVSGLERQRQEYGGLRIGAVVLGWMSSLGTIGLLLTGVLAVGLIAANRGSAQVQLGDTGLIVLASVGALILLLGIYAGSYAAGRMVRFDGGRQGAAVWLLIWVSVLVGGCLLILLDNRYSLRSRAALPAFSVDRSGLTLWGAIGLGTALLVTLLFAILAAKLGLRFHTKVDRAALEPDDAASAQPAGASSNSGLDFFGQDQATLNGPGSDTAQQGAVSGTGPRG